MLVGVVVRRVAVRRVAVRRRAVDRVLLRRALVRRGEGEAGIGGDGDGAVAAGGRDVVVLLRAVERVAVPVRGARRARLIVVSAAAAHKRDGEAAEDAHWVGEGGRPGAQLQLQSKGGKEGAICYIYCHSHTPGHGWVRVGVGLGSSITLRSAILLEHPVEACPRSSSLHVAISL